MEGRPRSPQDFDIWFRQSGDPWGYHEQPIRERLQMTVRFLRRCLDDGFSGHFLEIGAYNGDFTMLLGQQFPRAVVTVNDISEIALDRARNAVSSWPEMSVRTHFLLKDCLSITKDDFASNLCERPTVILLLECLYYLGTEEQERALANLANIFPEAPLVISGPVTGQPYFSQEELLELLDLSGQHLITMKVLNLRQWNRLPGLRIIVDRCRFLRQILANQMIFFSVPRRGAPLNCIKARCL